MTTCNSSESLIYTTVEVLNPILFVCNDDPVLPTIFHLLDQLFYACIGDDLLTGSLCSFAGITW